MFDYVKLPRCPSTIDWDSGTTGFRAWLFRDRRWDNESESVD
jgi:2-keto-3-deoxy-galactonokinase